MNCNCCLSDLIEPNPLNLDGYGKCKTCGLIFSTNNSTRKLLKEMSQHYKCIDPHKKVSRAKIPFYNQALKQIDSLAMKNGKKILDVGCGYGYFLQIASINGWKANGIEIFQDAVKSCRKKYGYKNIFEGNLKDARLLENSYDAITLWDVLAITDKPYDEIKECFRLLKRGGVIGIRTRNVLFQMWAFRFFCLIKKIALGVGLKEPYVFNKYCFSGRSINNLLSRLGFINIKITNSSLTSGDPYNHMPHQYIVKVAKTCINFFSKFIFWMTNGRCLVGPSLLIWAEKP